MTNTLKSLACLLAFLTTSAVYAEDRDQPAEIRCGDHWFAVEANLDGQNSFVQISGDFIPGDALNYTAEMFISTDSSSNLTVYNFVFGGLISPDQSLIVDFFADNSFGNGVYRSELNGFETNMNCYRIN